MVAAEQIEHLQQGLVWQAVAVAAIAHEQLEQAVQRRFVLLARQLLHGQLIHRFVILGILRQAAFQRGRVRQVDGLAQESQLRLGAGQRLLVLITLDRVEHGFRLAQLAAFGQAACVENQRGRVLVVFRQHLLE